MEAPPVELSEMQVERLDELSGRRLVLVGFGTEESARLTKLFRAAGAFCCTCPAQLLDSLKLSRDLILMSVADLAIHKAALQSLSVPLIAVVPEGSPANSFQWIDQSAADCVFYPASDGEILARAMLALRRGGAWWRAVPEVELRILLADDDPSVTDLLAATLERDHMVCRCCRNGTDALASIREWKPDLAVLDVNMPGMNGYRVMSILRERGNRIPILMLTACDDQAEVVKGLELGAEAYMVKPFNAVKIRERIRQIVARPR